MAVETTRITVRVPERDLSLIDALVEAGEYSNRTAVIRRAIRDLLKSLGPELTASAESDASLTEALLAMQAQQQLAAQRKAKLNEMLRR